MTHHLITLGLQIVPKSKTNLDSYPLVDKAIEVIQQSGVPYRVTPFETVMEGTYSQLMEIAASAQQAVLQAGADECLVYFRIHYRKDADVTFAEKKLDR
ncbi:MAG: thiamine-binding protein [Cyclobacteriaceae bacterium]|nr:thiamine-binding protein [Cyclobacteriaceae bacterium]